MHRGLHNRIKRLEEHQQQVEQAPALFVNIRGHGQLIGYEADGEVFNRQPGESEVALRDRLTRGPGPHPIFLGVHKEGE